MGWLIEGLGEEGLHEGCLLPRLLAFGVCQPLVRRHFNQGRCSDCFSTKFNCMCQPTIAQSQRKSDNNTLSSIHYDTIHRAYGHITSSVPVTSRALVITPNLGCQQCRLLHSAAASAARSRSPLSPQHSSIFLRPIPNLWSCTITTSMQIRETLD